MQPVAIDIEEVNRGGAAMLAARRGGAVLARWGKQDQDPMAGGGEGALSRVCRSTTKERQTS
jgi:hypothetical protein